MNWKFMRHPLPISYKQSFISGNSYAINDTEGGANIKKKKTFKELKAGNSAVHGLKRTFICFKICYICIYICV